MSDWDNDINEYCQSRDKDLSKVIGILTRKGWDPYNYRASMKTDLFNWLDQWYTLSVKNLPAPATKYKRNPVEIYRRMTTLPGGYRILTTLKQNKYLTQVLGGDQQFVKIDGSKIKADATHSELVERILYD